MLVYQRVPDCIQIELCQKNLSITSQLLEVKPSNFMMIKSIPIIKSIHIISHDVGYISIIVLLRYYLV